MTEQELKIIADNFGIICDYSPADVKCMVIAESGVSRTAEVLKVGNVGRSGWN